MTFRRSDYAAAFLSHEKTPEANTHSAFYSTAVTASAWGASASPPSWAAVLLRGIGVPGRNAERVGGPARRHKVAGAPSLGRKWAQPRPCRSPASSWFEESPWEAHKGPSSKAGRGHSGNIRRGG